MKKLIGIGAFIMSVWKPTETVTYIDGRERNGIKIDWKKVKKEYEKLKIPKDTYDPLENIDITKCGYVIDLSDRSRGKTTNKLIIALILYRMYGIELQYIKQHKSDVTWTKLQDLYETVKQFDYISEIFDGFYNDIEYYAKRWTLIHRDSTGSIDDKNESHSTTCFGLDENDSLKSSYNAPRGDMIFYDEFIASTYGFQDFVRFCDICKTIIRERISPIIFMSANTIDLNTPWFDEFNIRKEVEVMNRGDCKFIKSDLGTQIYVKILDENVSKHRELVNVRFWGFNNTKLASITGKGTWATESFPHIPSYEKDDEDEEEKEQPEIIQNRVFIRMAGKYMKLRLVNMPKVGPAVWVTPATKVYDDSIILTTDDIKNANELFGLGQGTFCDAYWKLYMSNKFFYARNSEGAFVKSYLSYYRTKRNAMMYLR